MKKKEWISKVLVTVTLALAIVMVAACTSLPHDQPIAPADPFKAILLQEKDKSWVSYQVIEVGEEYKVSFKLPEGTQLYLVETSEWGDEKTLSPGIWARPFSQHAADRTNWDSLTPITDRFDAPTNRLNVALLEERKGRGSFLWMYSSLGRLQLDAALLYADMGNGEWQVFWSPSIEKLNMLHRGRVVAVVAATIQE